MIVDTSALLAILFSELEAERFRTVILVHPRPRLSVASYVEAGLRVDRLAAPGVADDLDRLIDRLGLVLEPVSLAQARLARQAGSVFGKGRHPAGLNFGDCFAYALARERREPLLFKGNDFSRTDLRVVDP